MVLSEPRWVAPEGFRFSLYDAAPYPRNVFSQLGDLLLSPLHCCGRHWQLLDAQRDSGLLQTRLEKVEHIGKKGLLVVSIFLALIPGSIGSLIQCVSNSPLEKEANQATWELDTTDAQRSRCEQIGLYDFNQEPYDIQRAIRANLDFVKFSSILVAKSGNRDDFKYTITLTQSGFSGALGLCRPNGNDFIRNIVNGFLPAKPPEINFRQIKVLRDRLLGIDSATDDDLEPLKNHLAYSSQIELSFKWCSTWRRERPNGERYNEMDLKIFYR